MTSDTHLQAMLKAIVADNPDADEKRVAELLLQAVLLDGELQAEAVEFFVTNELKKRQH
jgi:hypothetical protein